MLQARSGDRKQFEAQCQATKMEYPFGRRHVNAKVVFTSARGLRKRPGMARALDIAGLPLEGRHHRGEDDAWNIAALILGLHSCRQWPVSRCVGALVGALAPRCVGSVCWAPRESGVTVRSPRDVLWVLLLFGVVAQRG